MTLKCDRCGKPVRGAYIHATKSEDVEENTTLHIWHVRCAELRQQLRWIRSYPRSLIEKWVLLHGG
jgi:hypothetical protein